MNEPAIDRVLTRLENVRKDGTGWTARCPAHDDQKNSLHVAKGEDGRVLLRCHAGCAIQQVVHGAELSMSDLFVGLASGWGQGSGESKAGRSFETAVATHSYFNEDGLLLFQIQRDAHKKFRQRRPTNAEPPAEIWIYNLEGVRKVLYRLPELRVAVGLQLEGKFPQPIFIVEGEKDADSLGRLGLVATTAPGGASAPWDPSYTESLRGASNIVILPDNDPSGAAHAEKVARALHSAVEAVRILRLPNLPEKGDVSDWIQAGGTIAELVALAEQAPVYSHPLDRYLSVEVGGHEFLARQIDPPESLIGHGVLTRPTLGVVVASAGRGNSQLIVQLAVARALGTDWLGLPVKQGRTALVLLELSAYWWQQRIRVAAGERLAAEALDNVRIVCRPDLKGLVDISTDEELAALLRALRPQGMAVVPSGSSP